MTKELILIVYHDNKVKQHYLEGKEVEKEADKIEKSYKDIPYFSDAVFDRYIERN